MATYTIYFKFLAIGSPVITFRDSEKRFIDDAAHTSLSSRDNFFVQDSRARDTNSGLILPHDSHIVFVPTA